MESIQTQKLRKKSNSNFAQTSKKRRPKLLLNLKKLIETNKEEEDNKYKLNSNETSSSCKTIKIANNPQEKFSSKKTLKKLEEHNMKDKKSDTLINTETHYCHSELSPTPSSNFNSKQPQPQ